MNGPIRPTKPLNLNASTSSPVIGREARVALKKWLLEQRFEKILSKITHVSDVLAEKLEHPQG